MIGAGGRISAVVFVACLVAALAGCASVPTGGPTFPGRGGDNAAGQADTFSRLLPAGPQPGVGESALVHGFLKDMGSFDENHQAARLYMTEERQAVWEPSSQVLVYGEMDAVRFDVDPVEEGRIARVRMRTPLHATIRTDGQYVSADQGETIDTFFDLTKTDGEWRIADLPDDLLLSRRDVDRVYRPLNLYYFNRDLGTLVPDPVFLPVRPTADVTEQLSRMLVEMLVDGPTDWLAPAVRSSFPEETKASVVYDSGRITVELSSEANGTGAEARFGMGAQLVWTLKQLPEIQEFTLRLDGAEAEFFGAEDGGLQSNSQEWNAVNPSGVDGPLRSYFMRDGQLWSLDLDQRESLVPGAAGEGRTLLDRYAVSLTEDKVAGFAPGDGSVRVAELTDEGEYTTVLSDGDYTSLSWDVYGNLWVVEDLSGEVSEAEEAADLGGDPERGDAASPSPETGRDADSDRPKTRLWLLPGGADPVEVTTPDLAEDTVTELRVSRDGSRVALLAGTEESGRVMVGRVVHDDEAVTLQGFLPLAADLTTVTDLSWRGADQLAVLGKKDRGALQAYLVPLNGSGESTSAGAVTGADMKTIAAGPGMPLLSGTEEDTISMSSDRLMWRRVADGTNPVYPG